MRPLEPRFGPAIVTIAIRGLLLGLTRITAILKFGKRGRTLAVILRARLFDSDWYLSQNPDVALAEVDPLAHYIARGAGEGRDPHPLFDSDWYLSQNPDVAVAQANPLAHYAAHGASEGRDPHPLFDTDWYVSQNPDVAFAGVNPLVHYFARGASEGRDPHPLFGTDWYVSQNPDVAAARINPLAHFVARGASEGRDPHPLFDSDWYLSQNPEVAQLRLNPLAHYVAQGAAEGRDPNSMFDSDWYLSQNPEVAMAQINPLAHYANEANFNGREPNWFFDTPSYLALNVDAIQAGTNPLAHYLAVNNGAQQRRDAAFAATARTFDRLSSIEPELLQSIALSSINNLRYVTGHARGLQFVGWQKLFQSFTQLYDRMIFLSSLQSVGSARAALDVLKAAQEKHGSHSTLLVVNSHANGPISNHLPSGTHVRVLSDLQLPLTIENFSEIITLLIYHLQPKEVLNINNEYLWRAIEENGAALSRVVKLYAFVLSSVDVPQGAYENSCDRFFKGCFPHMMKVYCDCAFLANKLIQSYGNDTHLRAKITVLYRPRQATIHSKNRSSIQKMQSDRYKVFWIGHLSTANTYVLMELARKCQNVAFHLYSCGEDAFVNELKRGAPPNIQFKGAYDSMGSVPVERYDAFLYTSIEECLPDALVEAAMRTIPILAADVGGVSELVDRETGWLVGDHREPEEYVEALNQIRNQAEVTRRVANMSARIGKYHSWDSFVQTLSRTPSFLE